MNTRCKYKRTNKYVQIQLDYWKCKKTICIWSNSELLTSWSYLLFFFTFLQMNSKYKIFALYFSIYHVQINSCSFTVYVKHLSSQLLDIFWVWFWKKNENVYRQPWEAFARYLIWPMIAVAFCVRFIFRVYTTTY